MLGAALVTVLTPRVVGQLGELSDQVVAGLEDVQLLLTGPPLDLGDDQLGMAVNVANEQLQGNPQQVAPEVVSGLTALGSALSLGCSPLYSPLLPQGRTALRPVARWHPRSAGLRPSRGPRRPESAGRRRADEQRLTPRWELLPDAESTATENGASPPLRFVSLPALDARGPRPRRPARPSPMPDVLVLTTPGQDAGWGGPGRGHR